MGWLRIFINRSLHWFRRLINWFRHLFGHNERTTTSVKTSSSPPQIVELQFELGSSEPPKYKQRESLFTYRERVFFDILQDEIGSQYQIFAKVRLGDIFWLTNEPENRKFHNNQLQCKHLDFLVCDKSSCKPLLAIELDDSSHDKYDHRERDEFKERLCNDTGLKLWRLRVQQSYAKGFIAGQVRDRIQSAG